jgi:Protein of unknown function (DUF2992)
MESIQFTVFFEDPFWVGLIEESSAGGLRIGRVVFGAEPSNAEIVDFVLHKLSCVGLREVDEAPAIPKAKRQKTLKNAPRRSLEIYKAAVSAASQEKKGKSRREALQRRQEDYRKRQEMKKKKRRGH